MTSPEFAQQPESAADSDPTTESLTDSEPETELRSGESAEPAVPADETEPTEPAEETEPDAPAEEAAPAEPAEPAEPAQPAEPIGLDRLAARATTLAEVWLAEAASESADSPSGRVAALLAEQSGVDFTVGFVDGVARPDDLFVAGKNLQRVAKHTPSFFPWYLRGALAAGGVLGEVIPGVVVPLSRRVLRQLVAHLVLDSDEGKLSDDLDDLDRGGALLDLRLLGGAVLGRSEASRHRAELLELIRRDDVDAVTITLDQTTEPRSPWAFDEIVDENVAALVPLFRAAAAAGTTITLDQTVYANFALTIAVFTKILDAEEFLAVSAGIDIPTALPDALSALSDIVEWATRRRARGGAVVTVRLTAGSHGVLDQLDADDSGWPYAGYADPVDADQNFVRVIEWLFLPERVEAVTVDLARGNLLHTAFALLLAEQRGVSDVVEVSLPLGVAPVQLAAVSRVAARVRLLAPVADKHDFDVAMAYLMSRYEDGAADDVLFGPNHPTRAGAAGATGAAGAFGESVNPAAQRFGVAVERAIAESAAQDNSQTIPQATPRFPPSNRTQDRTSVQALARPTGFVPNLDTDPTTINNRLWAKRLLARAEADTELGVETIEASQVDDDVQALARIDLAATAGRLWGSRGTSDRAAVVRRASIALEANRDRLIEVLVSERHITIAQADPEVSGAIDSAAYLAERAAELDTIDGAVSVPRGLVAVIPATGSSLAGTAAQILGALAAGSGAVVIPQPGVERTIAVLLEALWEAGVPRHAAQILSILDEAGQEDAGRGDLGRADLGRAEVGRADSIEPGFAFGTRPDGDDSEGHGATQPSGATQPTGVADPSGANHPTAPAVPLTITETVLTSGQFDRVYATTDRADIERLRAIAPELSVIAVTSGVNSIVVTPSADIDRAVADIVDSAFGPFSHTEAAPRLIILVGSIGRSERFRRQLVDAVGSLRVGAATLPITVVSPFPGQPTAAQLRAMTELEPGEKWLLEPARRSADGTLWSPGIRDGVSRGSLFHTTRSDAPVIGLLHVSTLAQAIEVQNEPATATTAGLHSLDRSEIDLWLTGIQVGTLSINRATAATRTAQVPRSGWKAASIGPFESFGGQNALLPLSGWLSEPGQPSTALVTADLDERVARLLDSATQGLDWEHWDVALRGAKSDAAAYREHYRLAEPVRYASWRSAVRYRPVQSTVRLSEDGRLHELVRVLAAAVLVGAGVTVSSAHKLPRPLRAHLKDLGVRVTIEDNDGWSERVRAGLITTARIRLIGGDAARLARDLGGRVDVTVYSDPVTRSGRLEIAPFVRLQSIALATHVVGHRLADLDDLLSAPQPAEPSQPAEPADPVGD